MIKVLDEARRHFGRALLSWWLRFVRQIHALVFCRIQSISDLDDLDSGPRTYCMVNQYTQKWTLYIDSWM